MVIGPTTEGIPVLGFSPEVRRMQRGAERAKILRRPANGDYSLRIISEKFAGDTSERIAAYDLVEHMQYLFIRIVKACELAQNENPSVKIRTSGHIVQSKSAMNRPGDSSVCFDLSDVPVRDPSDSPLASQWYHLEGGAVCDPNREIFGDLQLSIWIGTQANDAFP
ncbi:QUIRKY [Olea europaea subsp. europaea]|uniref:QUIRKY n=1 Tax=Olea europaea subsp. europaea TaxID=158383 RepID=A0A8S0T782_OLEEU|nr:QUIRKY [Olea europaea subsp. europaea]